MIRSDIVAERHGKWLYCVHENDRISVLFFPPRRLKSVCIPEQNTSQAYQTDLEVILEFLEEHCRQETRAQWQTGEELFIFFK